MSLPGTSSSYQSTQNKSGGRVELCKYCQELCWSRAAAKGWEAGWVGRQVSNFPVIPDSSEHKTTLRANDFTSSWWFPQVCAYCNSRLPSRNPDGPHCETPSQNAARISVHFLPYSPSPPAWEVQIGCGGWELTNRQKQPCYHRQLNWAVNKPKVNSAR